MRALADWPRVKLVLEGALACEGPERQTYLAEACGTDARLRGIVETLLAVEDRARTFLETPAAVLLDLATIREDLSGRVVDSYRLLSRLGAGGMSEVYLAHDTKLDRPVALKFLSPELAADQDRLRRFHQEARAASSLNHPHIVVVHDFGELEGRPFLVTEFVEGETLRRRLKQGPLATRDVVEISIQLAGALAAAHARGLVHRDIKPDNVMLRPDGYVKVLDFGIAKLALPGPDGDAAGDEPRTQPGMLLGTPRYMSPEQARGLDVDARSDVWSLGVVLYEMAAGRPPFDGPTPADAIAAILKGTVPPLDIQAPGTPVALCAVVEKALRRDRNERYPDADALLADLRRLPFSATSTDPPVHDAAIGSDDDVTVSTEGERRRATVLVSAVSEYAALLERLAAPEVEDLVGRIRAAAVDIVRRHGGVVNQSIGEEIVCLFGIPAAHEDDDLRAVRAAFELHARAREIHTAGGVPAGIRLQSGVHAGSVVARRLRDGPRRYAVTGPPMQTAARLAAAADSDAILLSPDCHRLVAPFVRTEPGTPVAVQAGSPPVTPCRALGESGLESRFDALDRGSLTPYTGRVAELTALQAHVDRARRGEGRVIVLVGEAGSGKSRMLHELRALLATADVRILQGRCRSSGGLTSYLPFVEALHGALNTGGQQGGNAAVAQVVARLRGIEASLEPFIPLYLHLLSMPSEVFPLPRHLKGEHLQAAILEALAAFFTSYAQCAPCLLLLEDWHWADEASGEALRHLADVVAASPVSIVVTSRPDGMAARGMSESPVRIHLGPLDQEAALEIVRAVLGVEHVPQELALRLHERTGGNPFFLEEVCHGLREAGVVTARGAEAVVTEPAGALQLPDSIQAVIRSRLDRLSAEGREVVRVASVIGREFSRQVLRDAMGDVDPAAALDRLKSAGIVQQIRVVPEPAYRFKHVLTQEVAYESLLEHQRRSLHLLVGRALQRRRPGSVDEPLDLLAHHFSRAEAWAEAIEYGQRAALRATELSQFADALAMLERVHAWLLRLPDDPSRRGRVADVLLKEERLCETLGMRRRQLQLSDELIALLAPHGASVRLGEAYLRQGDVSTLLKRFDAADRALATALRLSRELGDAPLERNALRSIGLLRWHQGRHADALAITDNALAIDRQREDDLAVAGDLSNLGNILRSLGQHDRALLVLEEALAMPVVANDPIKRAYILHNIAQAHRALGNVAEALRHLQSADASAHAHMLPIQRSFHLTSIAHIHLQEGRVADSLRVYHEAVDLSRRARHADGLAQSLRMLGEVLFALGRGEEALGHLLEAAQLFAQIEDRDAEAAMRHHAAVVLERSGHADAIAAWQRVRALAHTAGDTRAELDALEGVARATRALHPSPDAAIGCFEEALRLASRLAEFSREAALRNTLGILHWERGAYAEALGHYEAALSLLRALGDRLHEGLALNSLGATLSRLRRYDEARTALEEALAVNRLTGQRRLEAHTLAALGEVAASLGQHRSAVGYFEASLALRREIDDRRGERWMLHHIARNRALMGDGDGALAASLAAATIADQSGDADLRRAGEAAEMPSPRAEPEKE